MVNLMIILILINIVVILINLVFIHKKLEKIEKDIEILNDKEIHIKDFNVYYDEITRTYKFI